MSPLEPLSASWGLGPDGSLVTESLAAIGGYSAARLCTATSRYFEGMRGLTLIAESRDPLPEILLAAVWAWAMFVRGPSLRWIADVILAIPLVWTGVLNVRTGYAYPALLAVGTLLGMILSPISHDAEWWSGFVGAVVACLTFGALYVIGRITYRGQETLDRGVVSASCMVGATAGSLLLQVVVGGLLLNGILAITWNWRVGRPRMPYVAGLCVAALAGLLWP